MKDITVVLNNYRECVRHLWNLYFRGTISSLSECEILDRFEEIEKLLFSTLVLAPLGKVASEQVFGKEALPFLHIIPVDSGRIPILISRPSADRNKYWDDPIDRVAASEVDLLFVKYFDWDAYGYIDYKYYQVRIATFPQQLHLIGRDALVETEYARVFFDDRQERKKRERK